MTLKLRTKVTFGIAALLIFLLLICTFASSVLINKQNREASHELLKKSFTLISELLSSRQKKLVADSRQMAKMNDKEVINVVKNRESALYSMLKPAYVKIAEGTYNMTVNADIEKAAIYDMNGHLICFSTIDRQGNRLVGIRHKETIESATLKPGEQLNYERWKKLDSSPNIETTFGKSIPTEEIIRFEIMDHSVSLVSYVPIMGEEYNVKTEEMEPKQFGFITASQRLDDPFVHMLSRLTGTKINIFTKEGLSAGNFPEYEKYDLRKLGKTGEERGQTGREILFNDLTIQDKSYFQGVSPIYSGSECIAAIASLHSKEIAKANAWQMIRMLVLVFLSCILVVLPITLFFSNSMIRPISRVVTGLRDVAEGEGDLTARLEVKSMDEVGELAYWFNTFMEKLQGIIRNIAGNADTLNGSSSNLSTLSEQVSDGAEQMSSKVNTVASAGEEMSSNMESVASTMEEASTNISVVAASAEEVTSTINEIARNSEKARTTTNEAVSRAQNVSNKVDELGVSAREVDKVTEAITEISEQTNLLALNATIEAARAGEAGKGFAVVANEIKDLARQTAEATQEIKEQIDGIQNSTSGTISEIEQILKVINDIDEIVSTIAAAVEEQSVTTTEIAGNVAQVSQGIQEVSENVSQSSAVSSGIAKDIAEVNQTTSEISESSAKMKDNARELSELAHELKGMVSRFKV